jgi:flagellar biosynthetic protein FliO
MRRSIVTVFGVVLLAYPGLVFGFLDTAVSSPIDASATGTASPGVPADSANSAAPVAADSLALAPDFPMTKSLGGVGIVLSLILAGFFGARKFAPTMFRRPPVEKNLKVIETLSMGEKRSISVIQVEDKRFLIGNTAHQISLLAALAPLALAVEPLETAAEPVPPKANGRNDKFRNLYEIEKNGSPRGAGRPKTIPPDIRAKMRQLRETLEQ